MASLSSLLLASVFFLAGSTFFYRNDADGNKTGGTTTATHLHFYMHDDYMGPCPNAKRVVSGRPLSTSDDNVTTTLKTASRQFGDIVVLNNALTEGPSGASARMGTAQGWAVRVSEGGIVLNIIDAFVIEAACSCDPVGLLLLSVDAYGTRVLACMVGVPAYISAPGI